MGWSSRELIAVSASRLLQDRKVMFAGVGMPLVAAVLAKNSHAPDLTIVLEGGIVGAHMQPGRLPISTNEMRGAYRATMLTDITDIFLYAQRGFFDYGAFGTAQVDKYGNVNTSIIGDRNRPTVRLPGTGGANDIATSCREVFVVTTHEKRRFVEEVDFVTCPGYLDGRGSRKEAGLAFGGPVRVITDLAMMDFDDETKRMRVAALQPGVTFEQVQENTGFELIAANDLASLPQPTSAELAMVREFDPDRMFT